MSNLIYTAIINNPSISSKQRECEKLYKKYVDDHINNVKLAWKSMKENKKCINILKDLSENLEYFLQTMQIFIDNHDASKYSIDEWEPYRKNFYPVDENEKKENEEDFQKAWEHHYTVNMHHWDWWAKNNRQNKMPIVSVIEMCCDWIAMSNKFGGDAYTWYNSQKNIILGKEQKIIIESILKAYYKLD